MNTEKRNYNSLVCFLTAAFIIFLMVSHKTNPDNAGKASLSPGYTHHVTVSNPSADQTSTNSAASTGSAAITTVSVFI